MTAPAGLGWSRSSSGETRDDRRRPAGLADGVGEGEQVVVARARETVSVASRSTSHPRGALSRSLCSTQRS